MLVNEHYLLFRSCECLEDVIAVWVSAGITGQGQRGWQEMSGLGAALLELWSLVQTALGSADKYKPTIV